MPTLASREENLHWHFSGKKDCTTNPQSTCYRLNFALNLRAWMKVICEENVSCRQYFHLLLINCFRITRAESTKKHEWLASNWIPIFAQNSFWRDINVFSPVLYSKWFWTMFIREKVSFGFNNLEICDKLYRWMRLPGTSFSDHLFQSLFIQLQNSQRFLKNVSKAYS